MAVCDKTLRMLYHLLTEQGSYHPKKAQISAEYSAAPRKAASTGRSTIEGLSGEGTPGGAFGPHRGGDNPSVRAGPSPLHETRTTNRRSPPTWQTRSDLPRVGVEHLQREASPLIPLGALQ